MARPEALRSWDSLAGGSPAFRTIQQRLAIAWGLGLLMEAAVRVAVVMHCSVHAAQHGR